MAKTKSIVLNFITIAIPLFIIIISLNFFTNIFGTQATLLFWFDQLSNQVFHSFFVSQLLYPLTYFNLLLVGIAGVILTVKRFKVKAYPFIVTGWILPAILIHIYILFYNFLIVDFFAQLAWLSSVSINLSMYLVFPPLFLTVLAGVLKKKSFKDEISIRAPKSTMTFPTRKRINFYKLCYSRFRIFSNSKNHSNLD